MFLRRLAAGGWRLGSAGPVRCSLAGWLRRGARGWGNSDIEEMVAALETIYNAREEAQARALRGAANISRLTWTAQMNKLGELLLPLLPNT